LVLCGMVPFTFLTDAPLTQAFAFHNQGWQAKLVAIAAVVGLGATCVTGLLGQPRIFYRMAKNGLIFSFFAGVGETIPAIGVIVTGVVTGLIAFFIPEDVLADAISIGTLTAFSMVDAGIVVLRTRTASRPYRSAALVLLYTLVVFFASLFYAYVDPGVAGHCTALAFWLCCRWRSLRCCVWSRSRRSQR